MPDNKISISRQSVDGLKYKEKGQNIYFDQKLPGFAVRLYKTCKTYIVQARVNGKVMRRTIGKHGPFAPDKARVEAQSLLALMAKEQDPKAVKKKQETEKTTLGELFHTYISKRQLRPKTLKIYSSVMQRCFSDWQEKPITELTREHVEKRLQEISTANGPKGPGQAQAGQAYRLLRSLMRFAHEELEVDGKPLLLVDPTRNLARGRLWTKHVRRQGVIQNHQLAAWFEAVLKPKNAEIRDYLLLTILTGLRKNEGLTLTWANVDLKGKYLKIDAAHTKNHKEHRLPLADYLHKILEKRHGLGEPSSPYVFPGRYSKDHLKEPKGMIKEVIKDSKIQFMLHDLRRTFITVAEGLNIQAYTLKKLLNHSTSDVTSGYIVSGVERLREPMQQITDFILEQASLKKLKNPRAQ